MSTQFWFNSPAELISTEVWPTNFMSTNQKLNAISRLVIILSVLGFLFSGFNPRFLLIGVITILIMVLLYRYKKFEPFSNVNESKPSLAVRDESTPISTIDYETGRINRFKYFFKAIFR